MPKTFRRKRFKRSGAKLNRRQLTQVKKVVAINAELKHYEKSSLSTVSQLAPFVGPFIDIPQGDQDTQRDGDRLKLKNFMFRYSITLPSVPLSSDRLCHVRFIFFQWKPNDFLPPVAANILIAGPAGALGPYSFYNWDGRQQYKILYDRVHKMSQAITPALGPTAVIQNEDSAHYRTGRVKMTKTNTQIQYSAGSINCTNMIYLLVVTDSTAISAPNFVMSTRSTYTDS